MNENEEDNDMAIKSTESTPEPEPAPQPESTPQPKAEGEPLSLAEDQERRIKRAEEQLEQDKSASG